MHSDQRMLIIVFVISTIFWTMRHMVIFLCQLKATKKQHWNEFVDKATHY